MAAKQGTQSWDEATLLALAPDAAMLQLPAGALLGSYRIDRLLATGGMGLLYAAEHAEVGKRVAIKILHPRFNAEPDIVRRFFNEARAVNKIDHPNIVKIYDFIQEPNGLNYLVMELLTGLDLWEARAHGDPFTLNEALAIAQPVAQALAAAHQKRIVHRDLKPENVFLAQVPGRPDDIKLLDFGIAQLNETASDHRTRTGLVMGTPDFMAPEQALGARVDPRADVYAFGVLLYWLLAGRVPLSGAERGDLELRRHPPPLPSTTETGEPIPNHLQAMVRRCLAFDREQRFLQMGHALDWLTLRPPTTLVGATPTAPTTEPDLAATEASAELASGPRLDEAEPWEQAAQPGELPRDPANGLWGAQTVDESLGRAGPAEALPRRAVSASGWFAGLAALATVAWLAMRGAAAPGLQVPSMPPLHTSPATAPSVLSPPIAPAAPSPAAASAVLAPSAAEPSLAAGPAATKAASLKPPRRRHTRQDAEKASNRRLDLMPLDPP